MFTTFFFSISLFFVRPRGEARWSAKACLFPHAAAFWGLGEVRQIGISFFFLQRVGKMKSGRIETGEERKEDSENTNCGPINSVENKNMQMKTAEQPAGSQLSRKRLSG